MKMKLAAAGGLARVDVGAGMGLGMGLGGGTVLRNGFVPTAGGKFNISCLSPSACVILVVDLSFGGGGGALKAASVVIEGDLLLGLLFTCILSS